MKGGVPLFFCVHAALPHTARFFFSHGRRLSALWYGYLEGCFALYPLQGGEGGIASLDDLTKSRTHPTVSTRAAMLGKRLRRFLRFSRVPLHETATPIFRVRYHRVTKRSTRRPNASGPHIGTHGFAVLQPMQRPTRRACAEGETQARRPTGRQGHTMRWRNAYAAPWDTA